MTNITYALCDDRIYLEISGHACPEEGDGYRMPDPEGAAVESSPLACAATSILVITATESLRRLESDGMFRSARVTVEDGYACFDLEMSETDAEYVGEILSPIITGFELLEENYPELVKVG